MRCDSCDFENATGQNFCGNCGAALEAHQRCRACNALNPSTYSFCGSCRAPLKGTVPATAGINDSELRHITVTFCDITGSTSLSESMDVEDYQTLLERFYATAHEVIDAHRGYIAQNLGDGVLAYFGYPTASENDALRAIQASIATLEAFRKMNESVDAGPKFDLKVRIGVHTGNVLTGEIGSARKADHLAIGSVPNVAARLQSFADPGQVLISQDTYELVHRDLVTEGLGPKAFKGVTDPIEVYRAVGIRQQRADKEAESEPPFVGRERELSRLLELHAESLAGNPRLVVVRGEAGIGKSRLLDEFRQATEGSFWVTCRCSEFHQNNHLHPIISALARTMNLPREGSPEDRRRAMQTWMGGLSSIRNDEIFAAMFGVGPAAPERGSTNQSQRHKLELLKEWLVRRAVEPIVFVVEDVHWADPSTLELVGLLARIRTPSKLLIVITAREEFRPDWEPSARYHAVVEVGRLGAPDAERLMREWQFHNLPEEVSRVLVGRADGVPLYLEELTRAAVATRSNLSSADNLERFIPETLHDLLMARIDSLGDAKEILQVGAVLGRSFNRDILRAVIGDLPRLEDLLYRIVDSGLIVVHPGDVYRFKHWLIQNTAYRTLLRSRRTELHSRVVEAIERDFPSLMEAEPATVARHYEGAGEIKRAAECYLKAGGQAWSRQSAFEESVNHLNTGLSLVRALPRDQDTLELERALLLQKCEPFQARYGYFSSTLQSIYKEMNELDGEPSNEDLEHRFREGFPQWGAACMRGDQERTCELSRELAMLLSPDHTLRDAAVHFAVGSTSFYQGDFAPALEHLDESIRIGRDRRYGTDPDRVSGSDAVFLAYLVSAWCLSLTGRPDRGARCLEEAERLATKAFSAVQLKTWKAFCSEDFNEPEQALHLAREIEDLSDKHGFERWARVGRNFRLRGELTTKGHGEALLPELLEALEEELDRVEVLVGYELTRMADVLIRFGDLGSAERALQRSAVLAETNLGRLHIPELERLTGVLLARQGQTQAAHEHFRMALDSARATGARTLELRTHVSLGMELPDLAQESRDRFQALFGAFEEGGDTPLMNQARALLV